MRTRCTARMPPKPRAPRSRTSFRPCRSSAADATRTIMTPLLGLAPAELDTFLASLGEKPFRARQVSRWLHQHLVADVAQMTDLSKAAREKLAAAATIEGPRVVNDTIASDGTRKWLLDAGNGNAVETVFIPEDDRGTLCISSQAGCALDCAFCSTGKQGFNRNLTTAEIVSQLWIANRLLGRKQGATRPVTNVVLMGNGRADAEPRCPDSRAEGHARRRRVRSVAPPGDRVDFRRDSRDGPAR